jgi:hypothetical protein
MTPQLTTLMAGARAVEHSRAAEYARLFADEPEAKPTVRGPSWLARLRAARLWQQECPEHQL